MNSAGRVKGLFIKLGKAARMSRYHRPFATGARVFFTVSLAERGSDLLVREVDRLRAAVVQTRNRHPFGIDAFVVLPDHLHTLWTLPPGDGAFSQRWAAIKAGFSRGLDSGARRSSHRARREKGIWQRRFWEHHIRDEADYDRHLLYCWRDPVAHGLVARAVDWPLSSLHRDLRRGIVPVEALSSGPGVGCASAHRLRLPFADTVR